MEVENSKHFERVTLFYNNLINKQSFCSFKHEVEGLYNSDMVGKCNYVLSLGSSVGESP